MSGRTRSGLAIAGCLAAAIGCGDALPTRYPVSGSVEFTSGEPVRNATIEFIPEAGGPSPRGRVDAQGDFVLGTYGRDDGAPAGDYRVVVAQPMPAGAEDAFRKLGEQHAAHGGGLSLVALKHSDPETSGLTHRVESAPQDNVRIVVDEF